MTHRLISILVTAVVASADSRNATDDSTGTLIVVMLLAVEEHSLIQHTTVLNNLIGRVYQSILVYHKASEDLTALSRYFIGLTVTDTGYSIHYAVRITASKTSEILNSCGLRLK